MKRQNALLTLCTLAILTHAAMPTQTEAATIYVSPLGNDRFSGRYEQPKVDQTLSEPVEQAAAQGS